MTDWLSPHFSLEELTVTQVRRFSNRPSPWVHANLVTTALKMEAVRSILGDKPIMVTSGYRSPGVNTAVGGSMRSAHTLGYACDFLCPAFGSPLDVCRALVASAIVFDQIIEEGTWTHISFDPKARRQVLTKNPHGAGYLAGLQAAA